MSAEYSGIILGVAVVLGGYFMLISFIFLLRAAAGECGDEEAEGGRSRERSADSHGDGVLDSSLTRLDLQIPDVLMDSECTCPICLEVMEQGDIVKELQCKHCYHTDCLLQWLSMGKKQMIECPMCRQFHELQPVQCQEGPLVNCPV